MAKKDTEDKILDHMVWKGMDSLNEARVKYGQEPYTKEEYLKANPIAAATHGFTKRFMNEEENK